MTQNNAAAAAEQVLDHNDSWDVQDPLLEPASVKPVALENPVVVEPVAEAAQTEITDDAFEADPAVVQPAAVVVNTQPVENVEQADPVVVEAQPVVVEQPVAVEVVSDEPPMPLPIKAPTETDALDDEVEDVDQLDLAKELTACVGESSGYNLGSDARFDGDHIRINSDVPKLTAFLVAAAAAGLEIENFVGGNSTASLYTDGYALMGTIAVRASLPTKLPENVTYQDVIRNAVEAARMHAAVLESNIRVYTSPDSKLIAPEMLADVGRAVSQGDLIELSAYLADVAKPKFKGRNIVMVLVPNGYTRKLFTLVPSFDPNTLGLTIENGTVDLLSPSVAGLLRFVRYVSFSLGLKVHPAAQALSFERLEPVRHELSSDSLIHSMWVTPASEHWDLYVEMPHGQFAIDPDVIDPFIWNSRLLTAVNTVNVETDDGDTDTELTNRYASLSIHAGTFGQRMNVGEVTLDPVTITLCQASAVHVVMEEEEYEDEDSLEEETEE